MDVEDKLVCGLSIKEVPPNAIDMTKKGAKVFSGYKVMRSWSSIRSSE